MKLLPETLSIIKHSYIKNEVLMMKNAKKILATGLAVLMVAMYISIPATFMILLLSLLFVPPLAAIFSTANEGFAILLKELSRSEKESLKVIT